MTLPDRQSTSLQDEVRRAGQRIDLWRCWLYGYIAAPLILVTMFLLVAHGAGYVSPGFAFFMVTWLGSGLVGLGVAVAYRRRRRSRLRRALSGLAPGQRVGVLQELAGDPLADTRRIAAPLMREFGVHTE